MKKDLKFNEINIIIEEFVEDYINELGESADDEEGRLMFDSGVIEKNFKDKNELINDLISFLENNKDY